MSWWIRKNGYSYRPIRYDKIKYYLNVSLIATIYLDKEELNTGIQGIFITVDPERDTPQIVDKYIKKFSPKFIGLSGSSYQIQEVCKKYRVYSIPRKKDLNNDYIVSFVNAYDIDCIF